MSPNAKLGHLSFKLHSWVCDRALLKEREGGKEEQMRQTHGTH